jgi:hypothetical protein
MEPQRGHYLGTEIDGKWHKRYRGDGLFARGLGDYWVEGDVLRFRRYLTRTPLSIPLRRVDAVELGKWHAGRWLGSKRAIKLIWEHDGQQLSSGFVFTRTAPEAMQRAGQLRELISSFR